jgi:type IV pilus assembly protein PilQ
VGADWHCSPALGNTTPSDVPESGSITAGAWGSGASDVPTAVNSGRDEPIVGIGIALGSINGAVNLDVELSALERTGKGKILSTPRVVDAEQHRSRDHAGRPDSDPDDREQHRDRHWKDAALILRCCRRITSANTVIMKHRRRKRSPDFSRAVAGQPADQSRNAAIRRSASPTATRPSSAASSSAPSTTQSRTPGLNRVPLLRYLFKRNELNDESRELLIFITPRIIA